MSRDVHVFLFILLKISKKFPMAETMGIPYCFLSLKKEFFGTIGLKHPESLEQH